MANDLNLKTIGDLLDQKLKASEERIIKATGDFVHDTILPQFDNLATRDDIHQLKDKIDILDDKTNQILKYADAIEETTTNHEKRLNQIESTPTVAHELKKKIKS